MAYTDQDPNVVSVNQDDQEAQLRALLGLPPDAPLPVAAPPAPPVEAKQPEAKADSKDAAPKSDDKPTFNMLAPIMKADDKGDASDLLTPQFAPRDDSKQNFSVVPPIFNPDAGDATAAPAPDKSAIASNIVAPTASTAPSAPSAAVGGPVVSPDVLAAQQKLAALKQQGSGVSHHHGFGGGLLKALDIAGSIVVPRAMAVIPGTTMNYNTQVAQAQSGVGTALENAKSQADLQAKLNPQPKEGTPEAQTFNDLQTQINPTTGKNFTPAEAFQKVNEIREQAKPVPVKEGDEPLRNADNLGKALERSWQSGHPGQPLPDEYKLPPNATVKDLTRVQSLLKDARDAEQNATSKKTLDEMHRQTMSIQAANAASKNQKKTVEEQGIEAAAQTIAKMDPNDLTSLKDIASMRGDQRLLIYNRAKEINPQFNTAEVNRKIKMMDNFTNGADGKALQSFGTFLEHAGEASTIVDGIRSSNMPLMNKSMNWWAQHASGDPYITRLRAALEPVKAEAENFMLNGHAMHTEDKKAIDDILSEDASPAQKQAAIKQLGHTVQARYNEMDNRYNGTMKQHLPPESLSDEARNGANKIGLKIGQSPDAQSGAAPPVELLKEGTHTTFKNGQTWTLQNGKPVQIKGQ